MDGPDIRFSGVDLGPVTVRYPDVVVDVAGGRFKDSDRHGSGADCGRSSRFVPSWPRTISAPKAEDYVRLPSLSAYLVLAQDAAKAWVWVRGAGGFSPDPMVIEDRDAAIEIASLGIDLPLAEIYPRVEPR